MAPPAARRLLPAAATGCSASISKAREDRGGAATGTSSMACRPSSVAAGGEPGALTSSGASMRTSAPSARCTHSTPPSKISADTMSGSSVRDVDAAPSSGVASPWEKARSRGTNTVSPSRRTSSAAKRATLPPGRTSTTVPSVWGITSTTGKRVLASTQPSSAADAGAPAPSRAAANGNTKSCLGKPFACLSRCFPSKSRIKARRSSFDNGISMGRTES